MKKLIRADLTPDQFHRANRLMAFTLVFVEVIFVAMTFSLPTLFPIGKGWQVIINVVAVLIGGLYTQKHPTTRQSMLLMVSLFAVTYFIMVMGHDLYVAVMVFPVIAIITCYMNEVLIVIGAGTTFLVCWVKFIQMYFAGKIDLGTDASYLSICILLCILLCIWGCCKAVRLLATMNNESRDEINHKMAQQKAVADEVSRIVDQLAGDFNEVVEELSKINDNVSEADVAMDQIANGSENTANAAIKQAEMTNEIQERLETTNQAAESANTTTDELLSAIQNGKNCSDELAKTSDIVDENTAQISETVSHLVQNVNQVTDITTAIMEISSQTNLLALNASIEAARAGEAGKGFAVVADEIRQLADQTKNSTEKISAIISELTAVTNETQRCLQASVDSINVQREKVKEVNESFDIVETGMNNLTQGMNVMNEEVSAVITANQSIVDGIATLSGISQEISASSSTSREGLAELVKGMEHFSAIIEGTFDVLGRLKETASQE